MIKLQSINHAHFGLELIMNSTCFAILAVFVGRTKEGMLRLLLVCIFRGSADILPVLLGLMRLTIHGTFSQTSIQFVRCSNKMYLGNHSPGSIRDGSQVSRSMVGFKRGRKGGLLKTIRKESLG